MSSSQTENYHLNQWTADDPVCRSDFNEDNQKLDAALAALSASIGGGLELATGTYQGDNAPSRAFSLPFAPKAVYVCNSFGYTFDTP